MSHRREPPRFVLLRHECPDDYRDGPHWDLVLERVGVEDEHRLATWSLLELPSRWAQQDANATDAGDVVATRLPDHRAHYLDYEGPVSGGRGHVARVAAGRMEWLELRDELVVVRLWGEAPFAGELELARLSGAAWSLRLR